MTFEATVGRTIQKNGSYTQCRKGLNARGASVGCFERLALHAKKKKKETKKVGNSTERSCRRSKDAEE